MTNLNDSGAGSLRQAITDANSNPGSDSINFSVTGTITLGGSELRVIDSLAINGPGASSLAISGGNTSRLFWFGQSGSAETYSLSGLTLRDGNGIGGRDNHFGGAIEFVEPTFEGDDSLTISDSVLRNNTADIGGALNAAGSGTLTITNTTITQNSATSTAKFTWGSVDGAARYDLWVNRVDVPESKVIYQTGLTSANFTAASELPAGTYRTWVRAISTTGETSPYSPQSDFYLTSTLPAITAPAPNSSTSDRTPTLTWNAVPGTAAYDLWVDRTDVPTTKIIYVASLSTLNFIPAANLPAGTYRAWVRAVSTTGEISPWSVGVSFTLTAIAPSVNPADLCIRLTRLAASELSGDDDPEKRVPLSAVVGEPELPVAPAPCKQSFKGDISNSIIRTAADLSMDSHDQPSSAFDQVMMQFELSAFGIAEFPPR